MSAGTEASHRRPDEFWLVVLALVTGSALTLTAMLLLAPPGSGRSALEAKYAADQEKVWGHHKREAPETVAQCARQLEALYLALRQNETDNGHSPIETGVTAGFLEGEIHKYLSREDRKRLICPADPTAGTHYGTSAHPNSYVYLYTRYWLEKNGGKHIKLAYDSPLVVCRHHPEVTLILRHNGLVEIAPNGRYTEIRVRFAGQELEERSSRSMPQRNTPQAGKGGRR